jgi:hypothetical protein
VSSFEELRLPRIWSVSNAPNEPVLGLAGGTATVIFGALNVRNRTLREEPGICWGFTCATRRYYETNHLRSGLAYATIIAGAASAAVSAHRLLTGADEAAPPATQVGLTQMEHPDGRGELIPGLHVALRF